MERLYRETESANSRLDIERYMVARPCPVCEGKRLKPEALAVTIGGKNIMDVSALPVSQALEWLEDTDKNVFSEREKMIARDIIKEIRVRLGFLKDIGLDYLSINRPSMTLSGERLSASASPPRLAAG